MKIQHNQVIGQPNNPQIFCAYCCFSQCLPVTLYKCSVKSFQRTNSDIFKL